jgi:hypothetical protein
MLEEAFARSAQDKQVKAVYCKYGIDTDARNNMVAYLCTAFSAEDDNWAAQSNSYKASIDGPQVSDFLSLTSNARTSALASNVRSAYINARLLAAWGRAAQSLSPALPLAFVRHDFHAIKLMPSVRRHPDMPL